MCFVLLAYVNVRSHLLADSRCRNAQPAVFLKSCKADVSRGMRSCISRSKASKPQESLFSDLLSTQPAFQNSIWPTKSRRGPIKRTKRDIIWCHPVAPQSPTNTHALTVLSHVCCIEFPPPNEVVLCGHKCYPYRGIRRWVSQDLWVGQHPNLFEEPVCTFIFTSAEDWGSLPSLVRTPDLARFRRRLEPACERHHMRDCGCDGSSLTQPIT